MSYPSPSDPGMKNRNDRLQWVLEPDRQSVRGSPAGWDSRGTYGGKLGLSNGTTGMFTEDLYNDNGGYLQKIYNSFVKQDLINLAGQYAASKYGSPPPGSGSAVLYKYKSDIITSYFEQNTTEILKVIKPKQSLRIGSGGNTSYAYMGGDTVNGKLTQIWLVPGGQSVLNKLHNVQ